MVEFQQFCCWCCGLSFLFVFDHYWFASIAMDTLYWEVHSMRGVWRLPIVFIAPSLLVPVDWYWRCRGHIRLVIAYDGWVNCEWICVVGFVDCRLGTEGTIFVVSRCHVEGCDVVSTTQWDSQPVLTLVPPQYDVRCRRFRCCSLDW